MSYKLTKEQVRDYNQEKYAEITEEEFKPVFNPPL